jgi:tungstate transport system ATP-binding protein
MFPLLLTQATVRRRGKSLLGPVDLTLEGSGVTTVIGPNGAGKSTLLRVMHGIERLSSGSAHWAIADHDAQAQQAFVFQSPVILRRSVRENLRYPLKLQKRPKAEQDEQIEKWALQADLTQHLDLPANRLSGGERQKLALARALISSPKVLFLDEPCANLDGYATREIEALLQRSAAEGTTIILATHDMGQARRLSDYTVFLLAGACIEHGTDCLANPQTETLRAFLRGDIIT